MPTKILLADLLKNEKNENIVGSSTPKFHSLGVQLVSWSLAFLVRTFRMESSLYEISVGTSSPLGCNSSIDVPLSRTSSLVWSIILSAQTQTGTAVG